MKIQKLEIDAFGNLAQYVLEFSGEMQLIFGENEAGKSTIYQFILQILFGFPRKQKGKRDLTPIHSRGSMGGKIYLEKDGLSVVVERFKETNRGEAVVHFPDGTRGDEEALQEFLSPLNLEMFQEVFSFDQEQLMDIKKLTSAQMNKNLLAMAISGSGHLAGIEEELLKKSEALFKPRGVQPKLNRYMAEYERLVSLVLEKEKEQGQYEEILQDLAKLDQFQGETLAQKQLLLAQKEEIKEFLTQLKLTREIEREREKNLPSTVETMEDFQQEKRNLADQIQAKRSEIILFQQTHAAVFSTNRFQRKKRKSSKVGVFIFIGCLLLAMLVFFSKQELFISLFIALLGLVALIYVGIRNVKNSTKSLRATFEILQHELEELQNKKAMFESEKHYLEKESLASVQTQKEKEIQLSQLEQELSRCSEQEEAIIYEKQEKLFEKHRLESDGTLEELYQKKVSLEQEIVTAMEEFLLLRAKKGAIQKMGKYFSKNRLPQLLLEVSQLFSELTAGRYRRVFMEEVLVAEDVQRNLLPIFQLSTGTKDQLILALRLAYLTQGRRAICPFIMDDGFMHYDEKRKEILAKVLEKKGKDCQIFIFSSDTKMKDLFEKNHQNIIELRERNDEED